MSDTKNFWKGVFIGAIAGGALSLLDKPTRDAVMSNCKKTTKNVVHIVKNPTVISEKVMATTEHMRQTVEQVSEDITFIKDRVEEFAEMTPEVVGMVKETKEAFTDNENE